MNEIISIDIDGVLNYYPQCWLDYINKICGISFTDKNEAKKELGIERYKQIKNNYRKSSYKENLEVNKEAVSFLKKIKSRGVKIIISTSRPIYNKAKFPGLEKLTINWLNKNNIPYDTLIYKDEEAEFIVKVPNLLFHIDDQLIYANAIAKKGVRVFLYNSNENNFPLKNLDYINSNIIKVENIDSIFEVVPELRDKVINNSS